MIGGGNVQSIATECKRPWPVRQGGYAGPRFAMVARRRLPHLTHSYSSLRLIAAQGTMS
jgi:hypothetical protein